MARNTIAIEIRANVTRELYPAVRVICGGGLPETYDQWLYEAQRNSLEARDLNPHPAIMMNINLSELQKFVNRTGQSGQTALDNYAFEKAERDKSDRG